jgi:hypothetical protein
MASTTVKDLILPALAIAACCCDSLVDMGSGDAGQGTDSADTDADSDTDADADADSGADSDTDTDTDEICDEDEFALERVAPNMLILLDRSGTMVADVGITGKNRWEVCRDAIALVTNNHNDDIRFGLATFSSCLPGGCSAGAIQVPIAADNTGAIQDFLNATVGEGSADGGVVNGDGKIQYLCESGLPETSTGTTLSAMVGEPSLLDDSRENAILLLTDGDENTECIQDGVNGAAGAAALLAQDPRVQTYAVGFAGANLSELQAIAAAGGTVEPYFTNQPAELEAALSEIAAGFVSCKYAIPGLAPSADKDKVNFYFDGEIVFYDEDCAVGSGWTWTDDTRTEIMFCEEACDKMKSGEVQVVSATWGCDTEPIV